MTACTICLKHRGAGPLPLVPVLWEDPLVVVSHEAEGFLGHIYVETKHRAPLSE